MNDTMKQKNNNNNPWKILGIEPDSTLEQIKAAYRNKTKIHHPDKGGKISDWLLIQSAYKEITDKKYIPILQTSSTKMLDIKLTVKQQIEGVNDTIVVDSEDDLYIKVNIPPGAKQGDRFRVTSKEDNYIINVKEHTHSCFTRQGNHLIMYKTISIIDALKRNPLIIEGPQGDYLEVEMPLDVQNGTIIVVPEHGLYDRKTHKRGNIRINIKIDIPVITEENLEEFITRLRND